MAYLELRNIDVAYDGKRKVLDNLCMDIEKGQLVSLLGPSGCGKTTTLRVVGGLLEQNAGQVLLGGKDYSKVPIHKRNFGIVFQSYALFPHMTVEDNVAFGLKMRGENGPDARKKAAEMLATVDLGELSKRYPRELSGGQRQRVALARALVVNPELLLLDEPLSNLDAKLRLKMRVEIRELQQKLGITTLFVTHDQEECFSISDRVAVMNGGLIEQYDAPERIYQYPATEFVARFVGFENFFDLKRTADGFESMGVPLVIDEENLPQERRETLRGTIRPEDVQIVTNKNSVDYNLIDGKVLVRTYLGKSYQYKVETPFGDMMANGGNIEIYQAGDNVRLHLPKNRLVVV